MESTMDRQEIVDLMEQTGLLKTLLLLEEKPRFVNELIRSSQNPSGIGSYGTVKRVRNNLIDLGLAETVVEEGPPKTIYLKLTEKGQKVMDLLNDMVDTISGDK